MNLAKTLKPCNKNNYFYLTKYWSNIFYIEKYPIYIYDGVALSQVFKFEIKMRCVKRQYCRQVLFVVSSLCIYHKRHLMKRINDNIQTNDKIICLLIFTSYLKRVGNGGMCGTSIQTAKCHALNFSVAYWKKNQSLQSNLKFLLSSTVLFFEISGSHFPYGLRELTRLEVL